MLFLRLLVILIIADSDAIFISENTVFQIPKTLQEVNQQVSTHLFAFKQCYKNLGLFTGNGSSESSGTNQSDSYKNDCFWECVLTNIDMMKDGHLEYVGHKDNKILKDSFDKCSGKEIMKELEGCPLAHMFMLCEYTVFLEKATADLASFNREIQVFAKNSSSFFTDFKLKIEMINKNIIKNLYNPFF
ncbi:uncharacterized protein [Halyomorpha halys]|uniref:uncharacterized protein isoform X2 n=1 Tax=Halyomorpha halys TaxID=286706 RepID=UPI0006D508A2|nr:uncharacterized protein LOC106686764 isoform X2 [Halyomorpha halys]